MNLRDKPRRAMIPTVLFSSTGKTEKSAKGIASSPVKDLVHCSCSTEEPFWGGCFDKEVRATSKREIAEDTTVLLPCDGTSYMG